MILDTNALSAWADGNPKCRVPLATAQVLGVPSVVLGEYLFGIRQSTRRTLYEEWLATYLPMTSILGVSATTADIYASIRLDLKKRGSPIPSNDVWIAALALQHDMVLLSNDTHFDQVKGIKRVAF